MPCLCEQFQSFSILRSEFSPNLEELIQAKEPFNLTISPIPSQYKKLINELSLVGEHTDKEEKRSFFSCDSCFQNWLLIDPGDSYSKIFTNEASNDDWKIYDTTIHFVNLITEERGLTNNQCKMANCKNYAVTKSFYCPEHIYQIQGYNLREYDE